MPNFILLPKFKEVNGFSPQSDLSQREHQQYRQKADIRHRKIPKIRPFDLAFLPRDEFIGDQACHGRDQRSQPTQVDANDQRGQVLRKPRQQQRSRNITDHLAGGNAGQDFVPGDELL